MCDLSFPGSSKRRENLSEREFAPKKRGRRALPAAWDPKMLLISIDFWDKKQNNTSGLPLGTRSFMKIVSELSQAGVNKSRIHETILRMWIPRALPVAHDFYKKVKSTEPSNDQILVTWGLLTLKTEKETEK